ncbi:hypothetical protein EJ04DRAFT_579498 [Polyplosphaeria fusca]|uniref:Rhodopsin domain-containing protein n=1 Tax=Polyplosphaeria fusca TaxID=682080 RepID=A0A9P4QTZ4_9PLEO|nr:hypothetical protein EJ04DRAFT_579498 [Polyplosphaeria fusca]
MADDLDHTPAARPPPGRESNFDNPESRAYQLVIVIAICLALVVLFTSTRICTRFRINRSFGADDWITIIATIFAIAYSGLILHLLHEPGGGILGIHLWDVSIPKLMAYTKGSLADSILIRITNTLVKVGLLALYLRLFNIISHVRTMVWVGMFAVISYCIAFVITDLVACVPRSDEAGGWVDPKLLARCNAIVPDFITAGAWFNVFTDFYILMIPLHMIPKLGLSRNRQIGVALIFLTGLLQVQILTPGDDHLT